MKHVRLRFTADGREAELHPTYDVFANAPFVEYATALNWNLTGDVLGILHYVEGDVDAFEAAVRDIEYVQAYELEPAGDDAFFAYIRDTLTGPVREMWDTTERHGIVTVPPIEYHADGTVTLSSFGPADELQRALEAFPPGVSVTIEEVTGLRSMPQAVPASLSGRQREALRTAVDVGYYDVPREASHEAVADAMDCAPSTAAEHLRKAESSVIQSLFG